MAEPLIEAVGIDVRFGSQTVLGGVDAAVHEGEIVTLIGPNGAGKTTLVRVLLGLERVDSGTVARRPGLRIGYMPQRIEVEPTLPLTVYRFLTLTVGRGGAAMKTRVAAVLDEVGAGAVSGRPFRDLSGGEVQRVLLARALLRDPDLLVLDEPVQGVDVTGQAELYRLIRGIRGERGCGVLLVSHDLHLVMAATDRVICLNRHVQCAGHPEEVSRDPAYVALFGESVAADLAVYRHRPAHRHDHDHAGKEADHG